MNLQKVNVKFFAEKDGDFSLGALIPVFHRWIQQDLLGILLIDVAEYTHVHQGPGVLLIAHEANFSLDETDGRRGFLYNQKRGPERTAEENLKTAFQRALTAMSFLEGEPEARGKLKFNTGHFQVFVNDRLEAPQGEPQTAELEKILKPFLQNLYGGGSISLAPEKDPQKEVGFEVKAGTPTSAQDLLAKLGTA